MLLIVIVAGLITRSLCISPIPPGKLVDIGNCKLHINATGERNSKPTVVIEGGSGMATEFYHWLSEGLKDSLRVVRYDRAGIGHSEVSKSKRNPDNIANELHSLLKEAGESPPYILAGHSMGGPYAQVFAELYRDEVVGLALLDATHPKRIEIFKIPTSTSLTFRAMMWMYDIQGVLADLGILLLYDKLMGPILNREMEGLPRHINRRSQRFLNNGKYIRAYGRESSEYHNNLSRVGTQNDFDSLHVRVFPSTPYEIDDATYENYLKRRGVDLRQAQVEKMKMQEDFLNLSTNSKLMVIDGDHSTIFTKKANADIICREILKMIKEMEY